eukprot:29666-Amphidinium_carterae.1
MQLPADCLKFVISSCDLRSLRAFGQASRQHAAHAAWWLQRLDWRIFVMNPVNQEAVDADGFVVKSFGLADGCWTYCPKLNIEGVRGMHGLREPCTALALGMDLYFIILAHPSDY